MTLVAASPDGAGRPGPAAEPDPASASDPAAGWIELVDGQVEVAYVPGDHYTMLREPAVRAVASRIEAFLERDARTT